MDVSSAVLALANVTLAITRRGTPTLAANGRWVPAVTTALEATGVVYPATPRDVRLLPEGRRSDRVVAFFSTVELKAPQVGGPAGDVTTYQGDTMEVLHAEPWSEHGFWRSLLVKVGQ